MSQEANTRKTGNAARAQLWRAGVGSLAVTLMFSVAVDSDAQEVLRGGLKGALVGGIFDDAGKGAAIGATVGAIRKIDKHEAEKQRQAEAASRAQYQESQAYTEAPHTDFNDQAQHPSQPLGTGTGTSTVLTEIVLRKGETPLLGIGYPSDWRQTVSQMSVTAVSPDGLLWSSLSELNFGDLDSAEAGVKGWLKGELKDVAFRDTQTGERGARIMTGTAKSEKSGAFVEFAAAVFMAAPDVAGGVAFIADASVSDHYKTTVQHVAESIRVAEDFQK